jgi:hypothetical protein
LPAHLSCGPRAFAIALAGATLAASGMSLLLDAPALATNVAKISAAISPDRLGARGSLTVELRFTGNELGLPAPLQRAVVRFPAGMSLEIPHLRSCSVAQLENSGARECPRQSKLGAGHALVESRPASEAIAESVELSAFLGPPNHLQPTLAVLGQGTTPLAVRMVVSGAVLADRAPYGEKLVMSIPPIATVPLEPDASIVDLALTVGTKRRSRTANAIRVPRKCPAGGFPFAGEFAYADGSSGTATSTIRCPR